MADPVNMGLSLGANVGDCRASLRAAIAGLSPYVNVTAVSPIYETKPLYVTDQPIFFNIAAIGTTTLQPLALLWTLKNIENQVGRTPNFRYGPREIDIDIVFYGDLIMETPELTIPHMLMAERDFVLFPLGDIAPDWRHPQTKKTIADMRDALPERDISRLDEKL